MQTGNGNPRTGGKIHLRVSCRCRTRRLINWQNDHARYKTITLRQENLVGVYMDANGVLTIFLWPTSHIE